MNPKTQASLEFVMVMGLVLVIFMVMGLIIYNRFVESTEFKIQTHGKRIINSLADNINEVTTVGDGFSQCFIMPGIIYGDELFNTTFYEGEPTAFLTSGERTWSAPLATSKVICFLPVCENGSSGKPIDVWVTNEDEVIYLEDCGPCGGNRACITPSIFIDPQAQKVFLNDPVDVNVSVRYMENLNVTAFNITYDNDIIQFNDTIGIMDGDFLYCGGGITDNESDTGADFVYFKTWRTSPVGCNGQGVIATVPFNAIGTGRSPVTFINTTLYNPTEEIKYKSYSGFVEVIVSTTTSTSTSSTSTSTTTSTTTSSTSTSTTSTSTTTIAVTPDCTYFERCNTYSLVAGPNTVDLFVNQTQYGNDMYCNTTCTCPISVASIKSSGDIEAFNAKDYLLTCGGITHMGQWTDVVDSCISLPNPVTLSFVTDGSGNGADGYTGASVTEIVCGTITTTTSTTTTSTSTSSTSTTSTTLPPNFEIWLWGDYGSALKYSEIYLDDTCDSIGNACPGSSPCGCFPVGTPQKGLETNIDLASYCTDSFLYVTFKDWNVGSCGTFNTMHRVRVYDGSTWHQCDINCPGFPGCDNTVQIDCTTWTCSAFPLIC